MQHRPRLSEEHFLDVVYGAVDVDVLLITGMTDKAPFALFSHLVPYSRLLDFRVETSVETRCSHRGCGSGRGYDDDDSKKSNNDRSEYYPNITFNNDTVGDEAVKRYAVYYLLPFFHEDLLATSQRYPRSPTFHVHASSSAIYSTSRSSQVGWPCAHHYCRLISQATGREKVDSIACCEAGGFVFASTLASWVNIPLTLVREAGKLPQSTISVLKYASHISSSTPHDTKETRIEVGGDLTPRGTSVVVVDAVLATGKTLCSVLQLLEDTGISADNLSITAMAEFPAHRGRELLPKQGFGRVNVQSLLVIGGA